MKILIAPDKFKGSLTCFEVCDAITTGIKAADHSIETLCFPMADGGDGFAAVMQYYLGTETVECSTTDPLGRTIEVSYQWNAETKTAIVEMASASGLSLLKQDERDALRASSYGTGLLVKDAIQKGATKIILGLGGSATTDAGTGILAALGFQLTDAAGNSLEPCGKNLIKIDSIIPPSTIPGIRFEIASDVQNILYGKQGAAYVYAPQKGASPDDVLLLDEGLKHFATCIKNKTGKDIAAIPGTGAAGGIAAGLMAFFDVKIESGIGMVITASHIKDKISEANLLITGEGKIDRQTLQGKVVSSLALLAHSYKIPAIAFAGITEADDSLLQDLKLQAAESISSPAVSVEEAIANARRLLINKVKDYFNRK